MRYNVHVNVGGCLLDGWGVKGGREGGREGEGEGGREKEREGEGGGGGRGERERERGERENVRVCVMESDVMCQSTEILDLYCCLSNHDIHIIHLHVR